MTHSKALAPLFALLFTFAAGGCAWLKKMTDSSEARVATYKLFSLRVPAGETSCIASAQQAYQSCSQRTQAAEGAVNWGRCNGDMSANLKQCPGVTSHKITEHGKQTDVADHNCVADLPSGTEVYCWTIMLVEEDYFEDGSAMEANLRAP
jgi:hypothetical protein